MITTMIWIITCYTSLLREELHLSVRLDPTVPLLVVHLLLLLNIYLLVTMKHSPPFFSPLHLMH